MMGRMAPNNAVMWWCYGAECVQGAQSTSSIQAKTRVVSVRSDGTLDAVPADSVSVGQRGR